MANGDKVTDPAVVAFVQNTLRATLDAQSAAYKAAAVALQQFDALAVPNAAAVIADGASVSMTGADVYAAIELLRLCTKPSDSLVSRQLAAQPVLAAAVVIP